MNVTFCGHSQITKADNIANWLRNVTQDLIEQGATTFYLGGYGEFDSLAASILREQKKKYPQMNSTPFVRQYGILNNKWGVLLCRKEYQTNAIHQNSRSRL